MFTLPAFEAFTHVFYQLDKDMFDKVGESMEQAEECGEKLEEYYNECLEFVDNADHDIEQSYNMILTRTYLFIALRDIDSCKEGELKVTCNSLGFAGTHAVKREEDLELIRKFSPIGILEKIYTPKK